MDVSSVLVDFFSVALDVSDIVLDVSSIVLDVSFVRVDFFSVALDVSGIVLDVSSIYINSCSIVLDVSLVCVDFFSIGLDHLCKSCDIFADHVVEPLVFFFEPSVLLEDVINGHEPKSVLPAGGDLPEDARLLPPVLLLQRVLNVVPSLRIGVGEDTSKVFVYVELFSQLCVAIVTEPGLVVAVVRIFGFTNSIINGVLVVCPKAHSDHDVVPPVRSEDLGHDLEHALEAGIEPCFPSIEKQD